MEKKLQINAEPSNMGLIMYRANTLEANLISKKVLSVIKKEKGHEIEVAIQ